jgi:pyruvate, water dikinase
MDFLSELSSKDLNGVGSKAAYLGDLLAAGFNVPQGFVISADEGTRDQNAALSFFDKLGSDFVAVRTSPLPHPPNNTQCTAELESKNWVRRRDLLEAIEYCRDSASSRHARYYMQRFGISKIDVAILIQQMVDVSSSGVVFTRIADDPDQMEVRACFGSGEYVSIGKTIPDRYLIKRSSKKILLSEVNEQNIMSTRAGATQIRPENRSVPKLSKNQLSRVYEMAEKVVAHFGTEQDIEFGFDSKELWILQARPISF